MMALPEFVSLDLTRYDKSGSSPIDVAWNMSNHCFLFCGVFTYSIAYVSSKSAIARKKEKISGTDGNYFSPFIICPADSVTAVMATRGAEEIAVTQ